MTTKTAPKTATRNAYIDRDSLDGRSIKFIASTAGVKRDGIDLKIDGIDTTNFEANPVFLWAHDYSGRTLPIGKVTKIVKTKKRLDVTVEFDQSDEFARQVEQKYRDGFLNAVSIGWNIVEWQRAEEGDTTGADFVVTASDLLDVSAVPVPGDPSALMKTQREFLTSLGQELIEMSVDGDAPVGEPVDADTVTARLDALEATVNRLDVTPLVEVAPLVAIRDAFTEETTHV